jgi:orotate phosphoribosyltransferase
MTESGSSSTPDRLLQLIRERSFRQAPPGEFFTLASGAQSQYFFDLKKTMLDPEGISLIAARITPLIVETGARCVGGLAMGAVPLVMAALMKSHEIGYKLSGFWVRKEQKDHGTKAKADGYLVPGEKTVILEDVTTKGGSALLAVQEARAQGCEVVAVITIVDRQEGAEALLESEGIRLISLYTRDMLIQA